MHYIFRWLCCYEVNVCMSFKHLTYFCDFILIILSVVSVPVLLQVQIAEAKITHVIQLKHTLDLVPQLKVCTSSSQLFKLTLFHKALYHLALTFMNS